MVRIFPPRPLLLVRQHTDVRPAIVLFIGIVLALFLLRVTRDMAGTEQRTRAVGFLLILALIYLLSRVVLTRSGRLVLDPFRPRSFYSVFFGLYYVLPFLTLLFDGDASEFRFVQIGAAGVLAFICFQFGCNWPSPRAVAPLVLDGLQARALLVIAYACTAMLGALYYWRLGNGNLYTHANSYEVGTTAASSFFESFVLQLHVPVIFLFGLVASGKARIAGLAKKSLHIFLVLSFLLFVASSQFRLAATILPIGWIANRLFSGCILDWRTALRMGGIAVLALALIFTIRASSAGKDLAGSSNQLFDLASGLVHGDFVDSGLVAEATLGGENRASRGRAVAPLMFFNDVIEALDSPTVSFGYGLTFAHELREVIPRVLWTNKPVFLSTQILIRQQLGMSLVDNSPNPLLQFYYEFGWPGIAVGFFLMGLLLQMLVNRMNSVFVFMLLAFAWSAFIQVEDGLFLNLLVVTRAALIVYAAWSAILFILRVAEGHRVPLPTAPLPWPQRSRHPDKEPQPLYARHAASSRRSVSQARVPRWRR